MTLLRLLDRQGIFKGDLNTLQRLGLLAVIGVERQEIIDMKSHDFKALLIANYPQHADEILKEDAPEEEFSEDDLALLTAEDVAYLTATTESILSDIKNRGYSIEEF